MSYQDAYSADAGTYGMPDTSNGGAGPTGIPDPQNPGYDTAGYPLTQRLGSVTARHGGTKDSGGTDSAGNVGQPISGTGTPAATGTLGSGILAPFSEQAPGFPNEPRFDFPAFKPPSIDEAMNDPGYQFRLQQGQQALENWSAARGTLNDTGTAKSLIDYGQNAAEQGYGNVYARDYGTWQGNEQNAQNIYGINRQTQYLDPWTAAYNAWVQRGNFYLQNQGTAANTALGFAQL